MAEEAYEKRWLYHKDGRAREIESAAEERTLRADPGWADTPAAHGVVTAPSQEQLAQMPQVTTGPLPMPGTDVAGQMAFSHLLLQWQRKLDASEAAVATLRHDIDDNYVEAAKRNMALEDIDRRLHAVERWMVEHPAVASKPPPPGAAPHVPLSRKEKEAEADEDETKKPASGRKH